jgi:hypothetical protein
MGAFYRQFGWPEAPSSVPEHVVFQCTNGVVLGLFSATQYEPQFGEVAIEFRGFTLAINCDDATAVLRAHEEVSKFDDVREWTITRTNPVGGAVSASATRRTGSGRLPGKPIRSSMTAAASSIPDPNCWGRIGFGDPCV